MITTMKQLICLLTLCLLTAAFYGARVAESIPAPCKVGSRAAAYGFWVWPAKSTVRVYVAAADFKSTDLTALMLPFSNWNAVSDLTGSFVKFSYEGTVTAPLYCENCLTVMRGDVFDKSKRHGTELRAYSARRDQILTWATIVVDRRLTNPAVLTNAIAHELGHNFGLLDCYDCKPGSTVMIKLVTLDRPHDLEGPSDCDIVQVRAAYKELAVRVRPAPVKQIAEDEGEEPVDDDTPIVIRKP